VDENGTSSRLNDIRAILHDYLRRARAAVLWKLDGVSDYDVRRPVLPSGTNLLGMVKHLTMIEFEYFGDVFGRPSPDAIVYDFDADPFADWVAEPGEGRDELIDQYKKAQAFADATITGLPLDAIGQVPWWPAERNPVTLQEIIVHVLAETDQNRGQADVIRELIDGAVGGSANNANLSFADEAGRQTLVTRAEAAARAAAHLTM